MSTPIALQEWRHNNPDKLRVIRLRGRKKLRKRVLAFLGDKCIRCGFDDPRALQIDHVDGGGSMELRKTGPDPYYQKILKGAPGYQLLCANCNWIKRSENNEQPVGSENPTFGKKVSE